MLEEEILEELRRKYGVDVVITKVCEENGDVCKTSFESVYNSILNSDLKKIVKTPSKYSLEGVLSTIVPKKSVDTSPFPLENENEGKKKGVLIQSGPDNNKNTQKGIHTDENNFDLQQSIHTRNKQNSETSRVMLQLLEIINVLLPRKASQTQHLTNTQHNKQQLIVVKLTDGRTHYKAIQYKHAGINFHTKLGSKILYTHTQPHKNSLLVLTPESCTLLGGTIQTLIDAKEAKENIKRQIYQKSSEKEAGPPLFEPFKIKQSINTNTSTDVYTVSANKPSQNKSQPKDVPTMLHAQHEQNLMPNSQNIPPSRNTHIPTKDRPQKYTPHEDSASKSKETFKQVKKGGNLDTSNRDVHSHSNKKSNIPHPTRSNVPSTLHTHPHQQSNLYIENSARPVHTQKSSVRTEATGPPSDSRAPTSAKTEDRDINSRVVNTRGGYREGRGSHRGGGRGRGGSTVPTHNRRGRNTLVRGSMSGQGRGGLHTHGGGNIMSNNNTSNQTNYNTLQPPIKQTFFEDDFPSLELSKHIPQKQPMYNDKWEGYYEPYWD